MIIVDVNILLYAHNGEEDQHARCVEWLQTMLSDGERIGIPWHCFMAFLRLSTAQRGSAQPISFEDATDVINRWMEHPQIVIPEPGRRFWRILKEVGEDSGTRGRHWSDAYLAALAIENGAGFATFDRDFRKYKGLKLVEL